MKFYRTTIKLFVVALITMTSLGSCNIFSDEKVMPYDPADGISFASGFVPATRNLINSLDDITYNGSKISLFGRVTLSGGGVASIFDNTELTCDAAGDWSYSPTQYWLSSAVYDFGGFYPYKSSGFTHNAATKTITYAGPYVSQLSTTAQEDILVGAATRDVAADGKGIVTLPMKHALAAVRFSVRNATDNNFVVLGQYLQGIKNQGSNMTYDGSAVTWGTVGYASGTTATTPQFVCASALTTQTYSNSVNKGSDPLTTRYYTDQSAWYRYNYGNLFTTNLVATGNGISVPISATDQSALYSTANFQPNASGYVLDSDGYLLVVPQSITSSIQLLFSTASRSDLNLYCRLGSRTCSSASLENWASTARTVSLANLSSVTAWEAGKKYDYVITVSTSNILISVTIVPWVDKEIVLE
ncbi:MAG: fimbrillin family protein [Tidjanibacter sp.]|nr:fimbrillin family protein [Tidjanibacter sp.]